MSLRNFDKCERCRKSPAIIECIECGTSQRALKMCYECDKNHHQMFDKDSAKSHQRIPIKFEAKPPLQSLQQMTKSPLRRKYPEGGELSKSPPLRSGRIGLDQQFASFDNQRNLQASQSYHTLYDQNLQQVSRVTPGFSNQSNSMLKNQHLAIGHHFMPQSMSRNQRAQAVATDSILSPRSSQYLQHDRKLDQDELRMSSSQSNVQNGTHYVPGSIVKFSQDFVRSPQNIHEKNLLEARQSEAKLRDIQMQSSKKDLHINSIASPINSIHHEQQNDNLTTYYQRMAEEYRQKFLDLEREFNHHRLQTSHDIQHTREETESRLNQRHQLEMDEVQRQLREITQQKDYQIHVMKQQISELEMNLSRECEQIESLQRLQGNLEKDYKNSFLEFENKQKDHDDRVERMQKDHEYQLSKFERLHQEEKESIKRDYEQLLKQTREDYQGCSQEMKTLLDLKSQEIQALQSQTKDQEEKFKKERIDYEDALHRDRYTTELFTMENERLKLAKQDFDRERDELISRISALENELKRGNLEKQVTKQKTKKLERIVYGKK
eukprot:403358178